MSRDWNIIDDEPDAAAAPPVPIEGLDTRRIRSIVMERRAANRARLRALLVPVASAAVVAMAVTRAVSTHGLHPRWALLCLVIAAGAAWVGVRAGLRGAPAVAATSDEGASPPDFSTLPAGRSAAERLAEMGRADSRNAEGPADG